MSRLLLFFCLALMLQFCSSSPETYQNLDFEQTCTDSIFQACAWKISYQYQSDINLESNQGNQYLKIQNRDGVGFVEQSHLFEAAKYERVLHFTADIKLEDITGNGVSLNLGIYDEDGGFLLNKDFGVYGKLKGSADWSTYSIAAIIPATASEVKIGFINYGNGVASFDNSKVAIEDLQARPSSTFAQAYLQVALDSIRKHALYRDSVDLEAIFEKALWIAGDAQSSEEVHLATEYLVKSLNDSHSFFMPAAARDKWENNNPGSVINYSKAKKVDNFGYLQVPGFHSNDSLAKIAFADTLRQQIRTLANQNIGGWIVDLRMNDGGNMHPMLAGLEPLFSSDTLGFLVDIQGEKEAWGRGPALEKQDGADYIKSTIPISFNSSIPIAVLYGNRTGSSGEIVLISFIGNKQTKSFGQASFGLTTGNSEMELPDQSYLFLASTRMADRNGNIFIGSVQPDFLIKDQDNNPDLTLLAALDWLKNQ
ncbi:MAG: S41 family peptidase [Bacteroidota bacterium]